MLSMCGNNNNRQKKKSTGKCCVSENNLKKIKKFIERKGYDIK